MTSRKSAEVIPDAEVISKIFILRGKRVMIDVDLAELFGVPTRRLNEQVKRNMKRFPEDFMFQLTQDAFRERTSVIVEALQTSHF
jgi:hypothetical protein